MNNFRTTVRVTPSEHPIRLKSRVFTIGSCFADAIGNRLATHKFPSLVNPFGVIYNPASIHKSLEYAITNKQPGPESYLKNAEVFANYDFHSALSSLDKSSLETEITKTITSAHQFLKTADWLFITYGTAWVYERKVTSNIVANCHKMPADTFNKRLLNTKQIINSFEKLYNTLKAFNPSIRIIITLSPVRHIKDTLELNSASKSILRVACHYLTETFSDVEYFPAYEMMMDDLRDYRFYKSDMLHPNEEAENYIWENFGARYFPPDVKNFIKEWKSILSAISHRPFHPTTTAHQNFLKQTLKKLEELKTITDTEKEIATIKSQIIPGN